MSDIQTDNQDQQDQSQGNSAQNWRRQLEQDAATAKAAAEAAQAEAQAAKRELAFTKTGLDASNPSHKFFMDKYDGDADLDTITAAAKEFGFLKEPENPLQQNVDAQARIDAASQNAEPALVQGSDQAVINQILANSKTTGDFDWDAADAAGLVAKG